MLPGVPPAGCSPKLYLLAANPAIKLGCLRLYFSSSVVCDLSRSSSSCLNDGFNTTSDKADNACSTLFGVTVVETDELFHPAPLLREPPRNSRSSAIWVAVRDFVPLVSMSAVRFASPALSSG